MYTTTIQLCELCKSKLIAFLSMRARCQIGEYWPSNGRVVCRDSGAGGVDGFEREDLSGLPA